MANVSEVAKYVLYLNKLETEQASDEPTSDIDPMKLQKLLYYCQGYSLGLKGEPLFADAIEAWKYGPVVREVYQEFKKYKGQCIPLDAVLTPPSVDAWTSAVVHMVMSDKCRYSGPALMRMTHNETPWKEAKQKIDAENVYPAEEISQETMLRSFEKELTKEGSEEEEARLWDSIGRALMKDEARDLVLSLE